MKNAVNALSTFGLFALLTSCTADQQKAPVVNNDLVPPLSVENINVFPELQGQREDVKIEAFKDPVDRDRLILVTAYCPFSCYRFTVTKAQKDAEGNYAPAPKAQAVEPLTNPYGAVSCIRPANHDSNTCFDEENYSTRMCTWSFIPRGISPGIYIATFRYDVRSDSDPACDGDRTRSGGRVLTNKLIEIPK